MGLDDVGHLGVVADANQGAGDVEPVGVIGFVAAPAERHHAERVVAAAPAPVPDVGGVATEPAADDARLFAAL